MLVQIARLAIAGPRRILAAAVLVLVAAAVFGLPVAKSLSAGGFQDPASESAQAIKLLTDKFGQSDQQLVLLITAPAGAQSEPARRVATDIVGQVQGSDGVYNVVSAWTGPTAAGSGGQHLAADLVSKDGKSGLIVANLKGGENNAQNYAKKIATRVVHDRDGVTVRAGGAAMVYNQINHQNERDLLLMESLAIPLSFLVLVWVFGGMLTAALPVCLGGLAIVGSMTVLRLISFSTDVSIYALGHPVLRAGRDRCAPDLPDDRRRAPAAGAVQGDRLHAGPRRLAGRPDLPVHVHRRRDRARLLAPARAAEHRRGGYGDRRPLRHDAPAADHTGPADCPVPRGSRDPADAAHHRVGGGRVRRGGEALPRARPGNGDGVGVGVGVGTP